MVPVSVNQGLCFGFGSRAFLVGISVALQMFQMVHEVLRWACDWY